MTTTRRLLLVVARTAAVVACPATVWLHAALGRCGMHVVLRSVGVGVLDPFKLCRAMPCLAAASGTSASRAVTQLAHPWRTRTGPVTPVQISSPGERAAGTGRPATTDFMFSASG